MTYRVYGDRISGNCYKVKLALEQLGERYEWIDVDVVRKETRTPEFLAKNPSGQVPVIELPSGTFLPESNAILHYLADGSPLLPADRLDHAQVLRWMCFEQYLHEPTIAVARFIVRYLGRPAEREAELQQKIPKGYHALAVMERHLADHAFFVAERYTIADIALYAYTHVAHEGGFDLAAYPAVRGWLERVRAQPRHVPIG